MKQGCPHFSLLSNTVLKVLANAERKRKNSDWEGGKKDDMIVYVGNPKESTTKLLKLVNDYGNVAVITNFIYKNQSIYI